MPIYEFLCQSCGAEFEMVRSFSDSTTPACPKCADANVQRQLSRPAIHFKGSGWYINDSKTNSKASASSTESGDTNAGDSKPEGEKVGEGKEKENTASKGTESKGSDTKESVAKPVEAATTRKTEPAKA